MKKVMPDSEADQARIDAEAADWLVRRDDGSFTAEDRAAFETWSASDPRRARAFAAMSRTWAEAAELKHLAHLAEPAPAGWARRALRSIPVPQYAFRSVVLAAAAVAAIFVFGGSLISEVLHGHETGVGQSRVLTLSDGSTIVLGASSRVVVSFTSKERRVRLAAGEALFEVRHDAARPFVVEAGETVIRDVGTRFDVNRTGSSVRVAVIEGEVEVHELDPAPVHLIRTVQLLRAGDSLEAIQRQIDDRPKPYRVVVRPVERVAVTAWRDGRLVYENARLGDVIADVNRYYGPGVTLDPVSADLRVTASFRTNQIPAFLNTLDSALPVRVAKEEGGHFDVSQR